MIVVIGLGIIAFLFFYMGFKLSETHQIITVISVIFGILSMVAISSYILNNQDFCEIVVVSENTSISATDTNTSFGYDRVCFSSSTEGSGMTVYKLMNYFVRIFQWYSFVFIIYWIFGFFGIDLLKKAEQLFKK